MKGVILAGGTGSRLYPLSKATNKHLLPVGRYPMIYFPVYKMKEAGINDIMIVTGKEDAGTVIDLLGSGSEFALKFTYKVQDHPGGIAQALGLAEGFTGGDSLTVILGDNIFEDGITAFVNNFRIQDKGARILLKYVDNPSRFGIAEIIEDSIISIEEKPLHPKSNYCVTGIYMYDGRVFDIIKRLIPSARGELEITDVNNEYIRMGCLKADILRGWWSDAGTIESLLRANMLAAGITLDLERCKV